MSAELVHLKPTVWRIVRDTMAEAPPGTRRTALIGLTAWLALMGVQALDSGSRSGPAAVAEFFSALFGSLGGMLLGLAGILHASVERRGAAARTAAASEEARRVLVALPAVGLVSAALLAAAVTLIAVRGLLGVELPLVIILGVIFLAMLWLSAATVMQATRTLYAHAQAEAQAAAHARVAAADAQLSALQSRMNPHFLFNALNTVAALARSDPATAERVTENLSGVLRMTLERSAERMSTLGDEVRYVRAWLAVEQERWKERLRVEWDVPPDLEREALPPLVIQPLVENALRHGLGGRLDGGTIAIAARGTSGGLTIRVTDDGTGFPAAPVERTGLGNLRARLAALYGERASLAIERRPGGAAVTVFVPAAEAAVAGADR